MGSWFCVVRSEEGLQPELGPEAEAVITISASNFTGIVSKLPVVVVEFYGPWCGHCKMLAHEYEKAASILQKRVPPVVLAKVDADDESNKELAAQYKVKGYPLSKF